MKCERLLDCCDTVLNGCTVTDCADIRSCIKSSDARPIVSCEENNRKYQLNNTSSNRVVHYQMDGGIVNDPLILKCDRLLVIRSDGYVGVLVELKGNDVQHGIRQIAETLNQFPQFFNTCKRVHARIVATRGTPNYMASPTRKRLKEDLLTKYGRGTLEIKTRQYTENDTDLL